MELQGHGCSQKIPARTAAPPHHTGAGSLPRPWWAPHLRYPRFLTWDAWICSCHAPQGFLQAPSMPSTHQRPLQPCLLATLQGKFALKELHGVEIQAQGCGETAVVPPSQHLSFLNSQPRVSLGQRRDHKMLRAPLEGNTECCR